MAGAIEMRNGVEGILNMSRGNSRSNKWDGVLFPVKQAGSIDRAGNVTWQCIASKEGRQAINRDLI